jgi:hypothetical protein
MRAGSLGIGIVAPQATSPTFIGNFAYSQDGFFNFTATSWYELVGQVVSDGTSKVAGLADYNERQIALTPAVSLAGTYAGNAGRSTMQRRRIT